VPAFPPPLLLLLLLRADMRANFEAGHVCWDDRDLIGGRPTGAVRASFGYASSLSDAAAVAALVERYFVEHKPPPQPLPPPVPAASGAETAAGEDSAAGGAASQPAAAGAEAAAAGVGEEGLIEGLWVYPIKSCRGFSPPAWPLGESYRGACRQRNCLPIASIPSISALHACERGLSVSLAARGALPQCLDSRF
jgi:molybdenum cofactor sulfurtransferase